MSQCRGGVQPPVSITIDQLLALNAEMAALVRAGVPLERGLVVAGRDLKGRLGPITTALSRRLNRGESLSEALAGEGESIPPLYRAVVEAVHGRASCRSRSRASQNMCADTPRPGPPSGWLSGIRSWC